MHIDCAECAMRDLACGDCVVTFLIGPPDQGLEPVERAALAALAGGGLVPPLRMRPPGAHPPAATHGQGPGTVRGSGSASA